MKYLFITIISVYSIFELNAQCNQIFSLGSDVEICQGGNTSFDAGSNYLSYLWNDNSTAQTLQVNQDGTYYCIVKAIDETTNLVQNGDFESGNISFSSNYTYLPIDDITGPNAVYGVINNPNTWFNPFSPCPDHTSGTGNMMVLDGATVNASNTLFWCQNINVNTNTEYNFSYWAQSVTGAPYANIRVEINGVSLGTSLASNLVCNWEKTDYIWNSNSNNTAQIFMFNIEANGNGNDFAIDDIALNPICIKSDTVEVTNSNADTLKESVSLCEGDSFFMNNTFEKNSGLFYEEIIINNCTSIKEVSLTFKPLPVINAGNDTTIISGAEIALNVESNLQNTTFEWYLFNNLVSSNQSFITSINETSTFAVVAEKENCKQTDFIKISLVDKSFNLLLPTAFSPNNDGRNDFFRIVNNENLKSIELSIYNRWGERIHIGKDENHAWDGNYKGIQQKQGIYIFYIKTKSKNDLVSSESGTITLLR